MKTFISDGCWCFGQQALSGLGTVAPLHLIRPDEQMAENILVPIRLDRLINHGILRSYSDFMRCAHHRYIWTSKSSLKGVPVIVTLRFWVRPFAMLVTFLNQALRRATWGSVRDTSSPKYGWISGRKNKRPLNPSPNPGFKNVRCGFSGTYNSCIFWAEPRRRQTPKCNHPTTHQGPAGLVFFWLVLPKKFLVSD